MHLSRTTVALLAALIGSTTGVAQAQLVINEIDYDQPSSDTAEFIELFNSGDTVIDLSAYKVDLINGANTTSYGSFALSGVLGAGDYYVLCSDEAQAMNTVANCDAFPLDSIQNGAPDAVALLDDLGNVVDVVSYEGEVAGYVEGSGAPADDSAAQHSISRCPDGGDTGDNSVDFVLVDSTPGAPNACAIMAECTLDTDCESGERCVDAVCVPDAGGLGACGDPATAIDAVQGAGTDSPLSGQVVTIEGVVVGDFQDSQLSGIFVQEEAADADLDPQTSEGIFVYLQGGGAPVTTGDVVRIQGEVSEYNALTELTNVNDQGLAVCAASGGVAATVLTLPIEAVSDFERYEGMLVQFSQELTVTETYNLGRYGSLSLSSDGRLYQPTQMATPGADAQALAGANARRRIELDDLSTAQNPNPIPYLNAEHTRRVGDSVSDLTGILSGVFGTYRVHPTATVMFVDSNPRPSAPEVIGGSLQVASFNVLNFFTTLDASGNTCGPNSLECRGADSQAEYDRQLAKLTTALEFMHADVFGFLELENNATASLQAIVGGLNARLGAGTYAFVDSGTLGSDAIKVGIIYKPAVVSPVGAPAVLDSSVDPRFVDTKNRPVLAQTFDEVGTGARLTIAVVHLKSKGSACDDIGDPDTGDLSGNCNATRTRAAQALTDWLAADPTGSGDADFLVVGDFNAYAKEDPIEAMKAAGYQELVNANIGAEASSYVFMGESGYLDYAFASSSLAPQVAGVTEVGINSEEPSVLDYNLEFKTDDLFDSTDPFRASDHDPLLVGLDLESPPSEPATPTCKGLAATVYVRKNAVVGGPDDGKPYQGILRGTAADDIIVGTREADTIQGFDGDDVICARGGADVVVAGNGDDMVFGQGGDDELRGQSGDDTLQGGPGDDLLIGAEGDDTLVGNSGNDELRGHAGADQLNGGAGDDVLIGADGDDTLRGAAGNDELQAGAGDDSLAGGADSDVLRGGPGNDDLAGNDGDDTLIGGDGDDSLRGGGGNDVCNGNSGTDSVNGSCESVSGIP